MKPYLILAIIAMLTSILFNRKLNIFKIIGKQFSIFRNDRTKKYSKFDIYTFFISPAIISVLLIFIINHCFIIKISEMFITVLSIIATILFSFLAIIVDRKNKSENEKINQVSNETYICIIMTILYSLIAVLLIVCLLLLPDKIWLIQLFNCFIYYFAIKIILNLLMILKRMYILLDV